jgi:hypothetical protein
LFATALAALGLVLSMTDGGEFVSRAKTAYFGNTRKATMPIAYVQGSVSKFTDAAYAPLWQYSGTWQVTKSGSGATKPQVLLNQCALVGKYFTCQQSVNGAVSGLLVVVPTSTPEQYHTQMVMPDGRGAGLGLLKVEGAKWTFLSNWNQGGKTTFYRTTNVFTGKTHIHFEQQESDNNKDWKTTASGDEIRTSPGRIVVAR